MFKKIIALLSALSILIISTPNEHQVNASWLPNLEIHFINVGQADSILIKSSTDKTMLIDAGDNRDFNKINDYLTRQGVEEIDVMIATHPHHDHIGSMDKILNTYRVKTLIMPEIKHNTKYFKDLQKTIEKQNVVVQYPKDGLKFRLGFGIKAEIIGPIKEKYREINDYSTILRIVHGKNKFLFMGDAGKTAEKQLIKKYPKKLSADLLKVGHHGANTGTTTAFLDKVKPKYAIISAGKRNKFGFPSNEILKRLEQAEVEIYRTDRLGTIVVNSDGRRISITKNDVNN
jgi:competence protein ComEC